MNLLEEALNQFGHREIKGLEHNPEILKFFKDIGFGQIKDDETAWCSAFVNWCAMKANLERSKTLKAKDWLKTGEKVSVPKIGDIAIFHRGDPNSWQGHVGIYITKINKNIYVLSGNQGNMVNISPYPAERLIEYRRLNRV